jgi:hypothetical protein
MANSSGWTAALKGATVKRHYREASPGSKHLADFVTLQPAAQTLRGSHQAKTSAASGRQRKTSTCRDWVASSRL